MSLTVSCPNGHRLKVKESLSGSHVKCPKCSAKFLVENTAEQEQGREEPRPRSSVPATNGDARSESQRSSSVSGGMIAAGAGGTILGLIIAAGILWLLRTPDAAESPSTETDTTTVNASATSTAEGSASGTEANIAVAAAESPSSESSSSAVIAGSSEQPPGVHDSPIRPNPDRGKSQDKITSIMVDATRVVTLPYVANSFAVHPDTGDVAVVCLEKSTLTLFTPENLEGTGEPGFATLKPKKPFSPPVYVTFSRMNGQSCVLVSSRGSEEILIFAGNKLTPAPSLMTKLPNLGLDSTSGKGRPMLLTSDNSIISLDETAGNQREIRANGAHGDGQLSSNGTFVYHRNPSSAASWSVTRLLPSKTGIDDLTAFPRTNPGLADNRYPLPYVIDQDEVIVASGTLIFNADLSQKLGEFDFEVMDFVAGKPVAIGLSKGQLCAGSLNTFKTFGRVAPPADLLPAGLFDETQSSREYNEAWSQCILHRNGPYGLMIRADSARSRVVVCHRDKIAIVPLESFSPPAEVLLSAEISSPGAVMTGQAITVEAKPRNSDVRVTLTNPPDGAVVDGAKLTWTPTEKQAGENVLLYELTSGTTKIVQKHFLEVTTPHVDGPNDVPVHYVSINQNGQDAVAWTVLNDDSVAKRRLLLADLPNNQIISTRLFHWESISGAAVDQHYVYVASGSHLMVLNRTELNLIREWELEEPIKEISSAAGKYLVINGGAFVRSLPELQPTNEVVQSFVRQNRQIFAPTYAWGLNGFAVDNKLEARLFLLPAQTGPFRFGTGATVAPWSHDARAYPFDNSLEYMTELSESGLVLVRPNVEQTVPNAAMARYQVVAPVSRAVIQELNCGRNTLMSYRLNPLAEYPSSNVSATNGRVAIVESGDMYSFSTDTLTDPAGGALRIVPVQSKLEMDSGQNTALTYQILGGKAPYKATLAEFPISTVQAEVSEDGKVTITFDHEPLNKAVAGSFVQSIRPSLEELRQMVFDQREQKKVQKLVETRREIWTKDQSRLAQAFYTHATGAESKGIRVPLNIHVSVSDSEGSTVGFAHAIFSANIEDDVEKSLDEYIRQFIP